MNKQITNYVPGVCNINTAEIAERKKAGYFGSFVALALIALLFGLGINRYARVLVFVPLYIAAIGFLQAKSRFCVGYGVAGLHNADEHSADAHKVSDDESVKKDKKRAQLLNIQATLFSALLTLLIFVF